MARPKKEIVEVSAGVVRDVEAENPLNDNVLGKKPRAEGVWVKATFEQMAKYEAEGKLIGYDPLSGEVLLN